MANTPNIDLGKPAGTDHALVSVLNANSDKIDSFAGTTNQAIATKAGYLNLSNAYQSVSTLEGIKTFLSTKAAEMDSSSIRFVYFETTASIDPFIGGSAKWCCELAKSSTNYYTATCTYASGYNANAVAPIIARYNNGTWYFAQLAVKSTDSIAMRTIASNTNLNNLVVNGLYGCPNSTTTATLSNIPSEVTAGFALGVYQKNDSFVIQVIYYGAKIFTRESTSGGWSGWYKFTGTAV